MEENYEKNLNVSKKLTNSIKGRLNTDTSP